MLSELHQVIRLLLFLYRHRLHGLSKQNKPQSRAGLLVLLSARSRLLIYTVAAAGQGFSRLFQTGRMTEVVERLSSFLSLCDCPYKEELNSFSDNFGCPHFVCSFQVDQDIEDVDTKAERFLQRVSLIHSRITIIFTVKKTECTRQQVFSLKSRRPKLVMDHFISRDSSTYCQFVLLFLQSLFSVGHLPSCYKMHIVLGEQLSLLLPPEAVEAGLCGEMGVTTLATLGPCMNQYPNWPARLSLIRMLVYSPSGIPVMQGEGQTQLSFLRSLADPLFWGKLGLAGVRCADMHAAHGSLFYEMEFSTEDENLSDLEPGCNQAVRENMKADVRTVEQTITLFLLLQYRDAFHSQLFDFIASEEILERQLDRVLWHNVENVKSTLQSLLENTLRGFLSRKKSRVKLQSAMSVIVSSLSSIVSSSSCAEFRSACLNSMKVQNTNDLTNSLDQTLQRVISRRFVSRIPCTSKKAVEAVVSELNGSQSGEQNLPGKRAHKEIEESPISSPKRWCSGTTDRNCDSSESSWETEMTPLSSSQHPLEWHEMGLSGSSPRSETDVELKNQQVEREWLQELENPSEWD